jgi:hypothetical protein
MGAHLCPRLEEYIGQVKAKNHVVSHLPVLNDTTIALHSIRNEGNLVWSERVAAVGNPELLTHHVGWALTTCYSQHVSSLL